MCCTIRKTGGYIPVQPGRKRWGETIRHAEKKSSMLRSRRGESAEETCLQIEQQKKLIGEQGYENRRLEMMVDEQVVRKRQE